MKTISRVALVAAVFGALLAAGTGATAGSWDSTTNKMNPAYGEAVAYDSSDCTAPDAQGYMGFVDKPGVTYRSIGSFNDKASCITVGPNTRIRIYQHTNFGGKTLDINNTSTNSIKQRELSGWWNDTMSSIKVWKN